MKRLVQPELLDSLPPDDPRARGSRRDLRRVNWWMGHHVILARTPGPGILRREGVQKLRLDQTFHERTSSRAP